MMEQPREDDEIGPFAHQPTVTKPTTKPSPLPVNVDGIPESIRVERRWVVWNYEWREKAGKWTKTPYIATATASKAKSTDPATWRTFNDAVTAYEDGKCDGIGFTLGDGWTGFDADGNDAPEYVQLLDTYTERSPSGKGVHAICRGKKPGAKCRVGPFELYEDGRYFTVTGQHVEGTPTTVEERSPELDRLYSLLFPSVAPGTVATQGAADQPSELTDESLLAKARSAKNGEKFSRLWKGDTSGYPSPSDADSALCCMLAFWTRKDADRIDRLFRLSGLMRKKWVEKHGSKTYGALTISNAIASTKDVNKAPAAPTVRDETVEDLQEFLHRMDSQPDLAWHIPGLVPDEGTCLWHGQPRDFKSWCAQEVALALASGRRAFDIERFTTREPVRVAYFTEEDPERLFAARMRWLTVKSPAPASGFLFPFIRRSLSFDSPEDREFILRKIRETKAQVVVFDPIRSFTAFADKGPSDLRPVAVFLRQIQNETTAKTILLIHHDTKPPKHVPEGQERSRSQEASGGGIFSISDCPVSFTKLDWNRVAVYPEDYKLSGDPKPFEVTFTTDEKTGDDGPRFGTWVKPVAETKDEKDIRDDATAKKVLAFLSSTVGWHTSDEIDEGAQVGKGKSSRVLKAMLSKEQVLFCEKDEAKALGRSATAKLWSAKPPSDLYSGPFDEGNSPGGVK